MIACKLKQFLFVISLLFCDALFAYTKQADTLTLENVLQSLDHTKI